MGKIRKIITFYLQVQIRQKICHWKVYNFILYDKNSFIKRYGLLTQNQQNPWLVPGSSKDFRFVVQTYKIHQKLHIYPFKAYDTLLESLKSLVFSSIT